MTDHFIWNNYMTPCKARTDSSLTVNLTYWTWRTRRLRSRVGFTLLPAHLTCGAQCVFFLYVRYFRLDETVIGSLVDASFKDEIADVGVCDRRSVCCVFVSSEVCVSWPFQMETALNITNNSVFISVEVRWWLPKAKQRGTTQRGEKLICFCFDLCELLLKGPQTLRNLIYAFPCIKANINTDLSVPAGPCGQHVKVRQWLAGILFSLKCLFDVDEHGGDNVWWKRCVWRE